jgi:hypothetical protein
MKNSRIPKELRQRIASGASGQDACEAMKLLFEAEAELAEALKPKPRKVAKAAKPKPSKDSSDA